jgi:hypothetical protein
MRLDKGHTVVNSKANYVNSACHAKYRVFVIIQSGRRNIAFFYGLLTPSL